MYEIIDAHIHPFLTDRANLGMFKKMTPDEFVAFMKKCGISRAFGSVVTLEKDCNFRHIQAMNRECLRFRDKYPDFFIPGIHVHPGYPQESCSELEYLYRNEGVRLVGELVGYLMNFKYVSDSFFEIYAVMQKLKMPVNIDGDIEEIRTVAEAFPDLNIIIAHPNDGAENMKKRISYIKKYSNLYMDISGHAPDRWGFLRYAIDNGGREKLLFGSDFPVCNPAVYVSIVQSEFLTEDERTAVFAGNFKRLAGL